MKTIQVYDPPMCGSPRTCDTEVDPDLVNFAAMLSKLGTRGLKIERYTFGQQPMAFAQNPAVRALLEKEGTEALPLILLDGQVQWKGHYPTSEECPGFIRAALGREFEVAY